MNSQDNIVNHSTTNKDQRAELLAELAGYVHLDSGRKRRTDAGTAHNVAAVYGRSNQKMATYNRIKSRILNRDRTLRSEENANMSKLTVEVDCNGFYLPIPEIVKSKSTYYKQTYKGRQIVHTVARVKDQRYIDLEKYRFEAWQYQALNYPDQIVTPNPDLRGFLFYRYGFTTEQSNTAIINRQVTWQDLFEEIYFVRRRDIGIFDYETWRDYYDCCPEGQLDEDFRFIYGVRPGTSEFHPEWEYKSKKLTAQAEQAEEDKARQRSAQYIANMHIRPRA